jgi:hypothetical protein
MMEWLLATSCKLQAFSVLDLRVHQPFTLVARGLWLAASSMAAGYKLQASGVCGYGFKIHLCSPVTSKIKNR